MWLPAPARYRGVQFALAARLVWWKCSVWFEAEVERAGRMAEWQWLRLEVEVAALSRVRQVHIAATLLPLAGAVAATLVWMMMLATSNRILGGPFNVPAADVQASTEVRMTIDCVPATQPNELAVVADCSSNPPG